MARGVNYDGGFMRFLHHKAGAILNHTTNL
jgi:hypothetical protein